MTVQDKDTLKSYFTDGSVPVEADYIDLIDSMASLSSMYLSLPGIRMYYSMGAHSYLGSGPRMIDLVGGINLSFTSFPLLSHYNSKVPRVYLDGLNDYLSYVDFDSVEFSGVEAFISTPYRGMTLGGWVRPTAVPSTGGYSMGIFSKWVASNFAYYLGLNSTDHPSVGFSEDGTLSAGQYIVLAHTSTILVNTWYYIVGRYSNYSNRVYITLQDNTISVDSSSIAGIYNAGTASFEVGRLLQDNNYLFKGHLSNLFVSGMYLDDTIINDVFENTKALYGY